MRVATANLLSDKTFFIEFSGYLSNHVKHAIVALEKLNAPEETVKGYWDGYTTLTPYNLPIKPAEPWETIKPIDSMEQWKTLRGEKQKYQEMVVFLEQERKEKYNGDTNELVKALAPDLLGGIAGALTHGIIHLGWGIDAGSDYMTLEGLAYLNFCHLGVDFSNLKVDAIQEEKPMQSFVRVAEEWEAKDLANMWVAETKSRLDDKENFHPELVVAGFQWELAKVLSSPHAVATDLPTWLTSTPLDDVWRQLYEAIGWIYLATRDDDGNGNFLVMHLFSSLWGLQYVLKVIDDEKTTRKALQEYYASLVCLLSASGSGFPPADKLKAIQEEYPLSKQCDEDSFDWNSVFKRAFQEKEEHNIKLPYMMKELWDRYDHWQGFSEAAGAFVLTPDIGPKSVEYKV